MYPTTGFNFVYSSNFGKSSLNLTNDSKKRFTRSFFTIK